MKTKLTLSLGAGLALVTATASLAQENLATNLAVNAAVNASSSLATNIASSVVTNAAPPEGVVEYGQPLMSESLKDRLRLSSLQRSELKEIEDDFDRSRLEYDAANRPRIEAAFEANRQARAAKDDARIQASVEQFDQVWSAFRPEREAAMAKVKPLLTPEQLRVFDDAMTRGRR